MTLTLIAVVAYAAGWASCRIAFHRDHRRLGVDQLRMANATAATVSTAERRRNRKAARLRVVNTEKG